MGFPASNVEALYRNQLRSVVINRDEDPVIFGPPDPVLLSTDPDPTCNYGFIQLFFILNKIYSGINKFKLKMMGYMYNIEFYAYLPKIYIYFFLHFDFRSDPDFFFFVSDPDPWKKCRILIPGNK